MKDKFKKTSNRLSFLVVITIIMTTSLYLVIYYIGHETLDYYFETSEYIQKNEKPYVYKLQQYIKNNSISITECDQLKEWIEKQNITYLTVSKDGVLLYGITYVNGYLLAGNASESMHNNWIYFMPIEFTDTNAEVFIYADYTEKYYMLISIISAIFSSVVSLLFIFYGIQKEIFYLQSGLLKAKKDEDEMRESKNKLVQSMAHDLRTPLTGLMTFAEILKLKAKAGTYDVKYIDKILDKAIEIKNLTDKIFDYSVVNNVTYNINLELEQFQPIFEDYLSDLSTIITTKGFIVNANEIVWPTCFLLINTDLLGRIFSNLESNINKYAEVGSEIIMRVQMQKNYVHIIILNKIDFRKRGLDSMGIGLKNVDIMMRAMNGKLYYKQIENRYITELIFPTKNENL